MFGLLGFMLEVMFFVILFCITFIILAFMIYYIGLVISVISNKENWATRLRKNWWK